MIDGSLARRYAKALLELAQEENAVDAVGAQLGSLVALCLANQNQLLDAMGNPGFTAAERRGVLDAVLPRLAVGRLFTNFIRLVVDKNRFAALPEISREYGALADILANRVRATVTTASPASAELRRDITAALSSATGKEVVLETQVDPSVLGGLVARVGSKLFDASLRTRLDTLQVALATTALG